MFCYNQLFHFTEITVPVYTTKQNLLTKDQVFRQLPGSLKLGLFVLANGSQLPGSSRIGLNVRLRQNTVLW